MTYILYTQYKVFVIFCGRDTIVLELGFTN